MPNPAIHKLMMTAVQQHQMGKLREAEGMYRQVLAMEPGNADALHLLGALASQVGQHEAAFNLIRQAIAVRPEAEFYVNLAEALRGLGRMEDAATELQNAIRINPKLVEAYNNLGTTYSHLG